MAQLSASILFLIITLNNFFNLYCFSFCLDNFDSNGGFWLVEKRKRERKIQRLYALFVACQLHLYMDSIWMLDLYVRHITCRWMNDILSVELHLAFPLLLCDRSVVINILLARFVDKGFRRRIDSIVTAAMSQYRRKIIISRSTAWIYFERQFLGSATYGTQVSQENENGKERKTEEKREADSMLPPPSSSSSPSPHAPPALSSYSFYRTHPSVS